MLTEHQKMLAGELYNAADPELLALRMAARDLLALYNATRSAAATGREALLAKLLGRCGVGLYIEPPFFCDYGRNIRCGDRVYFNFNCCVLDCATVTIGDDVFFAPGVQLYTAYHPVTAAERIAGPELAAPISIGDRCWIGGGAILLPGVSVGPNTTIGAGSVVTRDVPANVVAAGNPCRVLRQLL